MMLLAPWQWLGRIELHKVHLPFFKATNCIVRIPHTREWKSNQFPRRNQRPDFGKIHCEEHVVDIPAILLTKLLHHGQKRSVCWYNHHHAGDEVIPILHGANGLVSGQSQPFKPLVHPHPDVSNKGVFGGPQLLVLRESFLVNHRRSAKNAWRTGELGKANSCLQKYEKIMQLFHSKTDAKGMQAPMKQW